MIYAVDFDGYLCQNAWPDIGKPKLEGMNENERDIIPWQTN